MQCIYLYILWSKFDIDPVININEDDRTHQLIDALANYVHNFEIQIPKS